MDDTRTARQLPDSVVMGIDRNGPVPLYHQLADRMERAIIDGSIPSSDPLENEISLAQRLGLSRPTVRRAFQELVDRGLVVRRRGIGTQVVKGVVTRNVELSSLQDDLLRTNRTPATRLIDRVVGPADDREAGELGLPEGAPVLRARRLRLADGVPLAVLENALSADRYDFDAAQLERFGLYELLRSRGVVIRVARQRIGARSAMAEEAKLLGIAAGAPLLTMERTAYDDGGQAVEVGRHIYRPDLYSFEVTLVDK